MGWGLCIRRAGDQVGYGFFRAGGYGSIEGFLERENVLRGQMRMLYGS